MCGVSDKYYEMYKKFLVKSSTVNMMLNAAG